MSSDSSSVLQEQALRVLRLRFPQAKARSFVAITNPERRSVLWRLALEDQGTDDSVILKQRNPKSYDPSDLENWDTANFLNDWAGLEFVSEVFAHEGLAPKFYGGDLKAGFYIMEDLASNDTGLQQSQSLVEPLMEGTKELATERLEQMMALLGRLHSGSLSHLDRYKTIRSSLHNGWKPKVSQFPVEQLEQSLLRLAEQQTLDPSFKTEIENLRVRLASPKQLVFGHADPCPDNWIYLQNKLRLIDFESAGLMHAGIDASYARMPFPSCWCCAKLPKELIRKLEQIYREAASENMPELLNDIFFDRLMIDAVTVWTVSALRWNNIFSGEDRTWGISSVRARVLDRFELLLGMPEIERVYPAIFSVIGNLNETFKERWGDLTLDSYPAFRSSQT